MIFLLSVMMFFQPVPVEEHHYVFDDWGDLLADHFNETDMALITRIVWCESRGKASARNPKGSAAGLFQVIRSTAEWVGPSVRADVSNETLKTGVRFNPYWNTVMAAYLFYETPQGVRHWDESRSCWGDYA